MNQTDPAAPAMPKVVILLLLLVPLLCLLLIFAGARLTGPVRETVELGLVAAGVVLVIWVVVDALRELIAWVRRFLSRPW